MGNILKPQSSKQIHEDIMTSAVHLTNIAHQAAAAQGSKADDPSQADVTMLEVKIPALSPDWLVCRI